MGAKKKSGSSKKGKVDLHSSFYFYAALLALKMMVAPLFLMGCTDNAYSQRYTLTSLRSLTPFFVIAALFIQTNPEPLLYINLLRAYFICRLVTMASNMMCNIPSCYTQGAIFSSLLITGFMGALTVYNYKNNF